MELLCYDRWRVVCRLRTTCCLHCSTVKLAKSAFYMLTCLTDNTAVGTLWPGVSTPGLNKVSSAASAVSRFGTVSCGGFRLFGIRGERVNPYGTT